MLSKKPKSIIVTCTSVFIGASILGGAVSAEQRAVSAEQRATSTEQRAVSTGQNNHQQNYQFPPANAVQSIDVQNRQQTQSYPIPYPAQKTASNLAPKSNSNVRIYGNTPTEQTAQNRIKSAPVRSAPYSAMPYANPYNRPPMYQAPLKRPPMNQARYGTPVYTPRPYGNPYNNPYNSPYNNPYYNPYNRTPFNNGSFANRPFGNSPFNNFGGGPFNNNGNGAPWEQWPFGARDSFWNRKEFPFKNQNPSDWFQPGDPKEGAAIMWDDLIAAPDDLGTMPGGWYVPAVSVPNPVDLEDQLEKASKEIPDLIRVYND